MISKEQISSHRETWDDAQHEITQTLVYAFYDCYKYAMVADETIGDIETAIERARAALDALEAMINECGTHSDEQPVCADPSCPCHEQAA